MSGISIFRPLESARVSSLESALQLKKKLASMNLNVATAESLTAGMITKTLIDIPLYGSVVYGGFVVYDNDAKREYIDITTKGVYTRRTAEQMAKNTLLESRAMVSIAVTGNAMPYPEQKQLLGHVDIGVGLRIEGTGGNVAVETKHIDICEELDDLSANACAGWKNLHKEREAQAGEPPFAPLAYTSMIADLVRFKTVVEACDFAVEMLQIAEEIGVEWGDIPMRPVDYECRPSPNIRTNLDEKPVAHECDPLSDEKLELSTPQEG